LVLGLKESMVECSTVWLKSKVILKYMHRIGKLGY
jgi:hypothetical protein